MTEREDEVRLVAMTRAQANELWPDGHTTCLRLFRAFESGITEEEARGLTECVGYALGNGMSKRIDIDAAQKLGAAFPAIVKPDSNAFKDSPDA